MREADDLMDALRRGVTLHEACGRRYAEIAAELAARGWPEQAGLMRRAEADEFAKSAALNGELIELSAERG